MWAIVWIGILGQIWKWEKVFMHVLFSWMFQHANLVHVICHSKTNNGFLQSKTLYLQYIMLKKNRLKERMAALNLFIIIIKCAVSTPLEVSYRLSLTYHLAIVQQTGSPVPNIEQNTLPLTKHHLANIDLLCLDVLMYCSDRLTSIFFFLKLCSENLNWPLPDSHKRTVSISSNVRLLGNMSFAVILHLHVNRGESICKNHCPEAQEH